MGTPESLKKMKLGIFSLICSVLGDTVGQEQVGVAFGNGLQLRETPLCKIGVPMGRRFLRTGKPPKVKKQKVKKDKTKKKKGGSSGVELNCSNLNLETLSSLPISDGKIEVENAAGAKEMIALNTITTLNLADNQLSNGDELKVFVSSLTAMNKLSIKNNSYSNLSGDLFASHSLLGLNLEQNPLVTLPKGLLKNFSFNKKAGSFLNLPCEMKSVPVSMIKMLKNLQKYATFCGKSFKQ